jgi:hypothetical protein
METPLSFLIGAVEFEWLCVVLEDDRLSASARQVDVSEAIDRKGRRLVSIVAETVYRNGRNAEVARALGTIVGVARQDEELLLDRGIHRYSERELAVIREAIEAETRAGVGCAISCPSEQPLPVETRVRASGWRTVRQSECCANALLCRRRLPDSRNGNAFVSVRGRERTSERAGL